MKTKFKHGDTVRYTGKFLRNTGQYVGAPVNGLVVNPDTFPGGRGNANTSENLVYVRWCDNPSLVLVRVENLEIDPRIGDAARDQVERELHAAGIIEDPDVDGGILG